MNTPDARAVAERVIEEWYRQDEGMPSWTFANDAGAHWHRLAKRIATLLVTPPSDPGGWEAVRLLIANMVIPYPDVTVQGERAFAQAEGWNAALETLDAEVKWAASRAAGGGAG